MRYGVECVRSTPGPQAKKSRPRRGRTSLHSEIHGRHVYTSGTPLGVCGFKSSVARGGATAPPPANSCQASSSLG